MIDQIWGLGNGLIAAPWWTGMGWPVAWTLIKIVVLVAPLMGAVAYLTLWERKAIGFTQIRIGPNRIGPSGLLQPIADAVKLMTKELILPTVANKGLFYVGPLMTITPALVAWVVIPFGPDIALSNINAGLLFLMAITSMEVYGVIIAGWSSNSKYALMGALRASAQMVSYEIAMGFCLVVVLMVAGSMNMTDIVMSQGRGIGVSDGHEPVLLELAAAAADLRRLLHLRPGRDQPASVRRGRGRIRDRRGPHDRVLGHELRPVLPGRVRQHVAGLDPGRDAVPGRLAAPVRVPRLHPGLDLAGHQDLRRSSRCSSGSAHRSRDSATTRSCAWAGRSSSR